MLVRTGSHRFAPVRTFAAACRNLTATLISTGRSPELFVRFELLLKDVLAAFGRPGGVAVRSVDHAGGIERCRPLPRA
jgi:hypothetical protein